MKEIKLILGCLLRTLLIHSLTLVTHLCNVRTQTRIEIRRPSLRKSSRNMDTRSR